MKTNARSPILLHKAAYKERQPLLPKSQEFSTERHMVTLQSNPFITEMRTKVNDLSK